VIRVAPNFSPAYSNMAQLINTEHIAFPGLLRTRDNEARALEVSRNAVQLDPVDSRAHLCMAWSFAMSRQYEQAVEHAHLASQLNDNDAWTMISSAHIFAYCANFQKAQELSKQSFDISPVPSRTQWDFLAKNRFLWGDCAGCLAAASASHDLLIALPAWTAAAHFHAGHKSEAVHDAQRFLAVIRSRWFGAVPPTDENIIRWFLHQYPISRREDWERLRDGLGGSGLSVAGAEQHHAW
jgi:tetratricopeptide (TPR) repeat protein